MATLTMNEITLRRTGHPPVRFRGELLAMASGEGQRDGKKPRLRWYEITLYRAAAGPLVVHIAYRTRMEGEAGLGHDFVAHASDFDSVARVLRAYNPIRVVVGHAASIERNFRADRLEQALRRSYDEMVGDFFEAVGHVESPSDPGPPLYFLGNADGDLLDSFGAWRTETYALGHRDNMMGFHAIEEAAAARRAILAVLGSDAPEPIITTLP